MQKPKFNPLMTKNNIQVLNVIRGQRNTVVLLKNNNPYNIGISGKLIFKDNDGLMIDLPVDSDYVRPFESAQVIALVFNNPENFGIIGGSIDPIELTVEDAHEFPSISNCIHPTVQLGKDGWIIKYEVATERDVCDGLTSELLMEFKQRPYLNVQVHDMGETSIQFNLDLDESITDNTDISGFNESNRLYRLTITINLTEAVIYRVDDYKKVEKVYLDFRTILTDKGDYESMSEDGLGTVIYEKEEGSNITEKP